MMTPSSTFPKYPPEQEAIRAKCFHPGGAFIEFAKEEVEQSIPTRFEKQVALYPDRLAVKTRRQSLTYAELNRAANRVAHAILTHHTGGEEPVALLSGQDATLITGILGVLKAGKMCMVLDPSMPRARTGAILEDSQAALLMTDGEHLVSAGELVHDHRRLLNMNALDSGLSVENPALSLPPDHLSYLCYTSGSTGRPKGVIQNHRNGLHEAMLYANGLHISAEDRLALLYSCSASQGMKILFGALLNGAALCLYDVRDRGLGNLADWLIAEGITIYFSIPAVFRQWTGALTGQERFPKLRLIQLGSDSVTPKEIEEYRKHFSRTTTLVVRLGSTETGTLRRCFFDHKTPSLEHGVPVGYAVEDMEVSLLDDEGKSVGPDEVGEITVKSRYLSPGYWRMADLTQAKFLPDPKRGNLRTYLTGDLGRMLPDGCLYHLGRKDFQLKIRGHRVEALEIESVLLGIGAIREAVVMAREDQPGEERLIAYLVSKLGEAPSIGELRNFLKDRLPDYMTPSTFVFLDALPLTANGKVDRGGLPSPDGARPNLAQPFIEPRTPDEATLAQIWFEVLQLERVGIHDNFFELGGHSLIATQVISRIREAFLVELPLSTLFESPTIAGLAAAIEKAKDNPAQHTAAQAVSNPERSKR